MEPIWAGLEVIISWECWAKSISKTKSNIERCKHNIYKYKCKYII